MKGIAAKALDLYEEEGPTAPPPKAEGDGYTEDVKVEMQAFLDAVEKKDPAAMATAFKEAVHLCK